MDNYKLYCFGSRSSWPVEGYAFNEYGGSTSCYVLKKGNYALIIDCGTGLTSAKNILIDCNKIDIILTYAHYDCIIGLLDNTVFPDIENINLYGDFKKWFTNVSFDDFFKEPFGSNNLNLNVIDISENNDYRFLNNELNITLLNPVNEKDSKNILIEYNEQKLLFLFDVGKDYLSENKINDLNIVIYNGFYKDKVDGYKDSLKLLDKCKPERIIITNHNPFSEDFILNNYEKELRQTYKYIDFARAGQTWDFPLVNPKEIVRNEDYFDFSLKVYLKRQYNKLIDKISSSNNRSFYTILIVNSFLSAFALIFTMIDLALMGNIPYKIFFLMSILFAINAVWLAKRPQNLGLIKQIFSVESLILITGLFVTTENIAYGFAWMLVLPTSGLFLVGRKNGTILFAIAFIEIVILLNTKFGLSLFTKAEIPYNAGIKLPTLFLNFYIICFVIETVRSTYSIVLARVTSNQEQIILKQTQELRDKNYSLEMSRNQLQMRNKLLNETFGKFLPEKLINEQIENKDNKLMNKKIDATVFRVGIRGFRKLTSSMDADDIVVLLNNYFAVGCDIITKNNGVVLEYVGDSILAVFGAPAKDDYQVDNALKSAIELQNSIKNINAYNRTNNFPEIGIGIGINYGTVVLGAIGNKSHLKYSAVGSGLELCTSLESRAPVSNIYISKSAYNKLKSTAHIKNKTTIHIASLENEIEIYSVDGLGLPYSISLD